MSASVGASLFHTVAAAPMWKSDPVPSMTDRSSWFGLFTTGTKAGTWLRFHKWNSAAPVMMTVGADEFVLRYEHEQADGRLQTYVVKYRREFISVICTVSREWSPEESRSKIVAKPHGDYFWLTEVSRSKWDGVL